MNAATPGAARRRVVAWGVTWGVGVGFVEALAVSPVVEWASVQHLMWWLLYWLVPFWCLVGCLFVWLADRYERGGASIRLIVAFIGSSMVCVAVHPLLSLEVMTVARKLVPSIDDYVSHLGISKPERSNWGTLSLYHLWSTLFYGALLIVARIFTVRAERLRSLLHQNAMARSRTESLLDVERLQALQSQIDPTLLLASMQELEQRYRVAPERAEPLLEALVDFLRYAMHGLRAPVSTVEAELKLARAFAHLQSERGLAGAWRIIEEQAVAVAPRKFPSLLMLPLLALGGERGRPLLRARVENGQSVISLHGMAAQVSAELLLQIRTRLHALYGDRFLLETPSPGANQLAITLQATRTS